ncbi:hypothetical protein QJS04_geneDACA019791 [Acorus gramineus]|uniref:Uncharacterized protein n=1 Tax=Acorus gramineus TaxID=55184 RepID=A0AAV8ZYY0_ACOGR|nr:hypothetical protein QJS04_geneDACA019791 [Acorus gramineus]
MSRRVEDHNSNANNNMDLEEKKKIPREIKEGDGAVGENQVNTDTGTGAVQEQSTTAMEPVQMDDPMSLPMLDDGSEVRLRRFLDQGSVSKREKCKMACWIHAISWSLVLMLVANYKELETTFTNGTLMFYNWCILSLFISSLSSFIAVVFLMKLPANPNAFFNTAITALLWIGISSLLLPMIIIARICSSVTGILTSDLVSIFMATPGDVDLTSAAFNRTYGQGPYLVFMDHI